MALIVALCPCFTPVAYASIPNIPPSIKIAVSYADTERKVTCADCFPSPWCGSPGVQFIGSSTNYNGNPTDTSNCKGGAWDTGAILVTNTGSTPITLTNLTVALPLPLSGNAGSPTCTAERRPITFNVWFGQQYYYGNPATPAYKGGAITIPAGGQAIFAGTTSDGTYKCPSGNYPSGPTDGTYDFDTSDAYFLDGCTPTTDVASDPVVTFWAAQFGATTYIDKGHTTDTGGIDTGNCDATPANPGLPNEALGWRDVGSSCGETCPTNQLGAATSSTSSAGATTTTTTSTSTITSTATTSGSVTMVTLPGPSEGVGMTTAYGIVAVIVVIVIIAAGYLAMRARKPAS